MTQSPRNQLTSVQTCAELVRSEAVAEVEAKGKLDTDVCGEEKEHVLLTEHRSEQLEKHVVVF